MDSTSSTLEGSSATLENSTTIIEVQDLHPIEGISDVDRGLLHIVLQAGPLTVRDNRLVDKTPLVKVFRNEPELLNHLAALEAAGKDDQRTLLIRNAVAAARQQFGTIIE
ncbi:hypothetical protein A3D88_03840 [Candidatus Peribacteria bacterium RIFCSPHIGHO2_02_FULL_52_16]|nr:MAG: hypothetical protein A2706_04655 [Candidatus Peribacteria bacterium RIFCSPHIGHO2_01_FULL_51_35]OGJ61812.1 MAG: hypothetical protein A3D88_03840 [Candidatus Peribacteria bacterium RIFCSPHIGHO2_02_FULL_52_16]